MLGVKSENSMTSLVETKGVDRVEVDPPAKAKTVLPLPWSIVETMDILADADLMKDLDESLEDIKAGRVVRWKPRNAQNTTSA